MSLAPKTTTPIDPALKPGRPKLCDPLAEAWRPDVPGLWPTCSWCLAEITTETYYAVAYPCLVLCLACSGLTAPVKAQKGKPR